jgi:hypothetical protein
MDPKLLEKYWSAETSLEEEKKLMEEMTGSDYPEAGYFALIAEARLKQSKLTAASIMAGASSSTNPAMATIRPLYRMVASAAAVLVFVIAGFGLWKYSEKTTQPVQMAETFDDPYEAYEEVREALAFVSSKLNHSQSEAMINIKKAGEYADMFK